MFVSSRALPCPHLHPVPPSPCIRVHGYLSKPPPIGPTRGDPIVLQARRSRNGDMAARRKFEAAKREARANEEL